MESFSTPQISGGFPFHLFLFPSFSICFFSNPLQPSLNQHVHVGMPPSPDPQLGAGTTAGRKGLEEEEPRPIFTTIRSTGGGGKFCLQNFRGKQWVNPTVSLIVYHHVQYVTHCHLGSIQTAFLQAQPDHSRALKGSKTMRLASMGHISWHLRVSKICKWPEFALW